MTSHPCAMRSLVRVARCFLSVEMARRVKVSPKRSSGRARNPMSKFVHLHTHSHYSLLEALPKIPELVGRCKNEGMSAMALTDNGALFGAIEFYQKMSDAGCKPILGLDAYLAPNGRHQKRARIDKQSWRLVLLAENLAGYKNLLKLSSIGYLEGFYYKPRIDDEILADHAEGLICLSGG